MRIVQCIFSIVQDSRQGTQKFQLHGISRTIPLILFLLIPTNGFSTGIVRGTVTSEGAPLARAVVRLLDINRTTVADQNGSFEFHSVPDGTFLLFVRMLGYESAEKKITVKADTVSIDIVLRVNPISAEEVVVSASPYARTADRLYQSAESRNEEELRSNPGSSFAEQLSDVPGVDVRYNGSAPARPVIRGLSDERVLMLENGLRTGDLSTFDPAHAVPIEQNTISQIDVVRGPSSIMYGPNTLGGLVNVMTNIVPSSLSQGLSGMALMGGNTVSDEYAGSARLAFGTGNHAFSLLFGGNHAQNLKIPTTEYIDPIGGSLLSIDQVPSSYHQAASEGVGYLYDNSEQSFGIGWKNYATTYGIPGVPPYISKLIINKSLVEMRSGLRFEDSFAKELQLSGNYSHFTQNERPTDADSLGNFVEMQGNQFDKKTVNATLQFLHKTVSGFEGAFGLWYLREDLAGVGDEILSPDALSTGYALYALEEYRFNQSVGAQIGLRYDVSDISTSPNEVFTTSNEKRTSNSFSASIGTLWKVDNNWTTSLTFARSFRPPTVLELFSLGVDAPSNTYDYGDSNLTPETGIGIDASIKGSLPSFSFEVTPYVNFISNYIYGFLTGAIDSASQLEVRQFAATDARLIGFEASADVAVTQRLGLLVSADYVQSDDRQTNQPLPFTPPFKGLIRFHYVGPVSADVEMRAASDQTRLGTGDTPTAGYAVFNAGLSVRFARSTASQTLSVRFDNIFDRLYRNHLSVIKDFVPMPGRGVRLTYRVDF